MKRLLWIDISKGLAILFVAYFHFFSTYFQHGVLPPPDWSNVAASALTLLKLTWFKISGLGFHAVGVFIILSGWTLMQSTVRRTEKGEIAWGAWYWARFARLYPMYWVAHLVYLVSPFVARQLTFPYQSRVLRALRTSGVRDLGTVGCAPRRPAKKNAASCKGKRRQAC